MHVYRSMTNNNIYNLKSLQNENVAQNQVLRDTDVNFNNRQTLACHQSIPYFKPKIKKAFLTRNNDMVGSNGFKGVKLIKGVDKKQRKQNVKVLTEKDAEWLLNDLYKYQSFGSNG